MTDLQKQLILCYYECMDPKEIDGLWGRHTAQATRELQRILGIPVDGVWGKQTEEAVREIFYKGAVLHSAPTEEKEQTGTFWDEIEYFTREEFRCQCGGKYCNGFHVEPEETLVRICDEIRRRSGVPILIRDAGGSGLRCPQWNATIPGAAANSYHTKGMAADLHPQRKTPDQLRVIAEDVMAEMIPGCGGLGLYDWGIHVDTGKYSRWDSRG